MGLLALRSAGPSGSRRRVAYQSAIEPRPYREPHSPKEAAERLQQRVRDGALDGDSVEAVLAVTGQTTTKVRRDDTLTPRETEILALVARGLSNREIAERLVLSAKTVRNHVERTYAKIGATNRVGASLYALEHRTSSSQWSAACPCITDPPCSSTDDYAGDMTEQTSSASTAVDNADIVKTFLEALQAEDFETFGSLMADDVVYENVGLPTIRGGRRVTKLMRGMEGKASFEVKFHRNVVEGTTVLNERTDAIVLGPLRLQFWVCGVFELRRPHHPVA